MGRASARRPVVRIRVGSPPTIRPDTLAGEEPLEIRVGGRSLAVTMRTPGHDMDLAVGFLLSEGVVAAADDVDAMRYCAGTDDDGRQTYNLLDVALARHVPPPAPELARAFFTSSSCGLCGKASIDAVRTVTRYDLAADQTHFAPEVLVGLPEALRGAQAVFATTGGLHAAGITDPAGRLLVVREDVGRHNAVDKALGWALRAGLVPLRGHGLVVSGRASFELTQKAAMAGVPLLAAVSAPSTLAVDLAVEVGLTLVGFLRGDTMNVYSGTDRVVAATAGPARSPVP